MKIAQKFCTIILTITFVLNCSSQNKIEINNKSILTDNRLNSFLGTWQYESNDLIFTLKLNPKRLDVKNDRYVDFIFGYYRLIKNKDTIINLLEDAKKTHLEMLGERGDFSLKATMVGGMEPNSNRVQLSFTDSIKNNQKGILFLELNEESGEMKWELFKKKHASYEKLSDTDTTYFSVPIRCTLKKQIKTTH